MRYCSVCLLAVNLKKASGDDTLHELEVLGHMHKQGWFMWFVSPSTGPKLKQQDYFVF